MKFYKNAQSVQAHECRGEVISLRFRCSKGKTLCTEHRPCINVLYK